LELISNTYRYINFGINYSTVVKREERRHEKEGKKGGKKGGKKPAAWKTAAKKKTAAWVRFR
jgi:hypothetical protein